MKIKDTVSTQTRPSLNFAAKVGRPWVTYNGIRQGQDQFSYSSVLEGNILYQYEDVVQAVGEIVQQAAKKWIQLVCETFSSFFIEENIVQRDLLLGSPAKLGTLRVDLLWNAMSVWKRLCRSPHVKKFFWQ